MKISTLHLMALLEKQRQVVQLTKRQGSEGFVAISALLATLLVGCADAPDEPLTIDSDGASPAEMVVPANLEPVPNGDGYIIANVTGYDMASSGVQYNGSDSENVYISPDNDFSIAMDSEATYSSFFPSGSVSIKKITPDSDSARVHNVVTLTLPEGEGGSSGQFIYNPSLLPGFITANLPDIPDSDNDGVPAIALNDGVVEVDWDDLEAVDQPISFEVTITMSDGNEHVVTVKLGEEIDLVWHVSDLNSLFDDLNNGKCDAIISSIQKTDEYDELFNFTRAYVTNPANQDQNYGILVRNESTELLAALDVAIGAVVDPDSEDYKEIFRKWFDEDAIVADDITATEYPTPTVGSTLAGVLESEELTLCTIPGRPPFYDDDGNIVGFDVDIANALVDEIEDYYII